MIGNVLGVLAFGSLCAGLALWWMSIQRVDLRRRRPLVNALLWTGGGFGLLALLLQPGILVAGLAGTSLGFSVLYSVLLAFSGQSRQTPGVSVGAPLPEFSAITADGEAFRSADLRGRPVLIKFFRGHW